MAKLYFEIEADYHKVIRLREEIEKLQRTMKGFSSQTSAQEIKHLEERLRTLREEYGQLTDRAARSAVAIEKSGFSMGKALAAVGGVAALKTLGSEIIRVRGEFQEMETAIETLVGKDMANKLMPQIKDLAKVSPLTMTDIVGAEKMMLGFNIEADKTIGFLKALSDVSMGSSQKFNSLTLAFSQMSATGKLMGQDLNQMINAGFNPLQQISQTTGKSIATLKEEMSKGAISAEMVQQAFIDATSAGGKFYKMSENASKTINGQISMLEDAWDSALNEMGQKSEDFIMKGIEATTTLVQNYEAVGKILVSLVAAYGTYKAALLANIALEKTQAISRLASITHTSALSVATGVLTKKVALLNAVCKANPYVLLASAVVGIGTAMWALSDHTSEAEKGLAAYNREQEKATNQQTDMRGELEKLVNVLNDENSGYGEREGAIRKMKASYTDLAAQFMDEKGHIKDLAGFWEEYGKKALEARKKAKESQLTELQGQYDAASWSYNTAKKLGNRRDMKTAKDKMDFLQPQIEAAKKDLEEINKTIPKEDDKKTSYKEDFEKAKKEWEDAKKELAKIEKDKANYSSKQYTDAKANEKSKREAYEKLGGKTDKQLKKEEDAAQKEKERKQRVAEEILEMQRAFQQSEIDIMNEGSEKREAQIELDYQKEMDAISRQKQEWLNKQNGKLTDEQYASLDMMQVKADTKRDTGLAQILEDEKAAMFEYLREFGDFAKQREGIIGSFTLRINKAATEGEKLSLTKQMERELAAVDDAAQGTTSKIVQLFEDMSDKTVEQMRAIADEAERILEYVKKGTWVEVKDESGKGTGKDQFGFTKNQFNAIKEDPEKIKAIGDGIKSVRKEADEASPALDKMSKAFKSLLSGDTNKFEEKLADIQAGVGAVTQAAEFLGNSLASISDAFGGNFLGGIAEGIGVATDAVNSAMQGAEAGKVFGPWGAAAGAAIGLVTSLTKSLSKLHDKKHENKIIKIQEQIDTLEKSYDLLGEKIEDSYSKDASNLIEDQNKLLEQQKILIQQQIKEEEAKKKTDNDRIKEWQEQLEQIDKTIEENKEAAVDAIFGQDLQSAIEDFASAYVDAWNAGEDKAKSAKDMVKNMIKGMITESIKAAASDPMKKIREKLMAFWQDEYISGAEQEYLENMAENLQKDLDSQFGWADSIMNDSSYSQEASSKGFQTMSQDTGDELNGRFTAIQISNEEIKNHVSIINMTTSEIKNINTGIKDSISSIQDQIASSYLELVAINENTGVSAKCLKDIKGDISEMKERIKNL